MTMLPFECFRSCWLDFFQLSGHNQKKKSLFVQSETSCVLVEKVLLLVKLLIKKGLHRFMKESLMRELNS